MTVSFQTPEVFVERLDMKRKRAVTYPMDRDCYLRSVFLDERLQARGEPSDRLTLEDLCATWRSEAPPSRPLRVIFHTALAGSTLLCRGLDWPGRCLPYREPFLLHQISFMRRLNPVMEQRFHDPSLVDLAGALLSRSFTPEEIPVIKPSDSCINLAESLLQGHPESRGLLLYQDLDAFVSAMLRDDRRRTYLRDMVDRARRDLATLGRLEGVDTVQLSDAQAGACVWLAIIAWYRRLLAREPHRYRTLNARDLFDAPGEALPGVIRWFRLPLGEEEVEAALEAGLMERHAKNPGIAFNPETRRAHLRTATNGLSGEVDEALRWAEDWGEELPVAGPLSRDLLNRKR